MSDKLYVKSLEQVIEKQEKKIERLEKLLDAHEDRIAPFAAFLTVADYENGYAWTSNDGGYIKNVTEKSTIDMLIREYRCYRKYGIDYDYYSDKINNSVKMKRCLKLVFGEIGKKYIASLNIKS